VVDHPRLYDVGTPANRVGVSIATVSQHLTKLRLAGVITPSAAKAGTASTPWTIPTP
jgi:hypothetical protein